MWRPLRHRPSALAVIWSAVTGDRYLVLQTGYREALLTRLALVITELQEEGDFTVEQIEAAVRICLEGGSDGLRHHRLAQEFQGRDAR